MSERRGYSPTEYAPNEYASEAPRALSREPYSEGPTETYEYRRSTYDTGSDRKALTRDPNRRSSGYYENDRYDDRYDDDRSYYRENERSRSRRGGDDKRSRSRGARAYDQDEREESRERGDKRLSGYVGKEKKDLAATAIGAVAGAFLGHEAGRKHGNIATIGGAVLGGLAANAWEHQHLKRKEDRKREARYEYEEDEYSDDDRRSSYRR